MALLNKPSKELVLDLVNADNGQNFSFSEVSFTDPLAVNLNDRNTQVTVKSVEGSGYFGTDTVYYNRLDLDVALVNNDPDGLQLSVPNDGAIDTLEVCTRLNKMFNYQLGVDDIVQTSVDTSVLPVTITLQAKPTSLAWYGSKELTLVVDRPMWSETFTSTTLAGFQMPSDIPVIE